MITEFCIILNNKIIFCSDECRYNTFEIILYLKDLLTNINPKNTWRLHKITLESVHSKRETIIIKHIVLNGDQLFFCMIGEFSEFSIKCYELLRDFQNKVEIYYNSIEILKQAHKKVLFNTIIENIVDFILKEYEEFLDKEWFEADVMYNDFKENKILYCGISADGLPIIYKLFSNSLLKNLDFKVDDEKKEIWISNFSSKLSTLAVNALIRANSHLKSIHIKDIEENSFKYSLFGVLNGYTVEMVGIGNYFQIQKIFDELLNALSKYKVLQNNFNGDLKPYRALNNDIEQIVLYINK